MGSSSSQGPFSNTVDASLYAEVEDLCGGIQALQHRQPELDDKGTLRCQKDWNQYVAPLKSLYKGSMAPHYSITSVIAPECLSERLEILSYANEWSFLHDDDIDMGNDEDRKREMDDARDAFREGATLGYVRPGGSGKRHVISIICNDMLSLDRKRAIQGISLWADYLDFGAGRRHHDADFATLKEYLDYRILDFGESYWMGMMLFGLALDIPEEETQKCLELARPGMMVVALQNDYFSYDKEQKAALRDGKKEAMNSVSAIMREHSVDLDEGKRILRLEINKRGVEYKKRVEAAGKERILSEGSVRYAEAVMYTLSGQPLWCMECLRYHAKNEPNTRQAKMINDVFPEYKVSVKQSTNGSLPKGLTNARQTRSGRAKTAFFPDIAV